MENSPIHFAVYQFIDKRVVTLVLSEGFCKLYGYTREECYSLMDNDMYRDIHPDDASRIADAAFRFATEERPYNVVYRVKLKNEYRILHARGEHVFTESGVRLAFVWYTDEGRYIEGTAFFENGMDKSFTEALHKGSLFRKNYYDHLTGLPNMSYFFELAEAAKLRLLEQAKTPVLLFFNLNDMKYYNSQFGFSEGDKLLIGFAKILVQHFSHENCSRFGQDHFTAITDEQDLENTLQKIFEECRNLNNGNSLPVRVGIYPDRMEAVGIATACDRAKYACDIHRESYMSGFYYFDKSMLAQVNNRQYIINNLDKALQEKWIKVYYQPIIRAANGRVCDEEALARWIDPKKGFLSPGEFIPVLESAKLITKLDLYVLDEILQKLKDQKRAGLYIVPQSLNLSRSDFDSCDIVEEIRRRVDDAGIPREKLTIEITESIVGSDFDFMKEQICRFQDLGFKVWMDDFGSGYSSLDVLQNIHFDLIKLDMRFLQQFDKGDESKIILTELIRMALGLGIDTVTEGVETKEQADFLKEVGCTKLQGFYYCKAIPLEEIVERNKKGIQIGYENPEEEDYFATLGRINLYDQAILANEAEDDLRHYFNTLPMAIVEFDDEYSWVARCNQSFRNFLEEYYGDIPVGAKVPFASLPKNSPYKNAVLQCREKGSKIFFNQEVANDLTAYSFHRHVAVNPVTGIAACVAVILGISDDTDRGVTYTNVAQALSADYINLYYVNLDTEEFTEYKSSHLLDHLNEERRGTDFFNASRRDALDYIYESDRDYFISNFTKENVIYDIEQEGAFTLSYRLLIKGEPVYVNMKAVRMGSKDNRIIIGVNNVDAHMKRKEALERLQAEQITYARISALAGDYLCIYTVDPETDHYIEYSGSQRYDSLGLAKEGDHFFEKVRTETEKKVYKDDLPLVLPAFTKENVMREIKENGLFVLQYRLVINGEPIYINARAAMVQEKDGPRLIVGINNVDAQVRGKSR